MDMSKSSRRKQTKPIRVYEGEEGVGSDQAPPQPPPPAEDYSNGVAEPRQNSPPEQHEDMPVDLHVVPVSAKEPKIKEESIDYSYPTAYHRLGSEFYAENKFISNGHPEGESAPPPPREVPGVPDPNMPKLLDSEMKEFNGEVAKDGNRIFHPDAYCELCDREFCNKYFLKTHKANKHGIYENVPSPFSMGPGQPSLSMGPGQPSLILPPEPLLPSPYKLEPAVAPSQSLPPKKEVVSSVPTSFKLDATPHKADTPALTPTSRSPTESSTPKVNSGSGSSTTAPDMEDYCEICQKHFCNKYYLKKHKQDVHGIVPENSSSSSSKRSRAAFDIPITATTSSQMILPQSMAGLPNMPNLPPGVMVLNPFMPPVAIIPSQSLLPHQQVHPPPQAVISQPMPVSAPAHSLSDQVPPPLPSSLSSATSLSSVMSLATSGKTTPSIPNDALRGIGVLNAEAYCEMCRKEFCNKYFLRIHMANKHGVFTDDLFPPSPYGKSMDALESSMLSPSKMAKTEVKQEPGSQPSPSGSDSYITFCNLCNKEFSSKYSYKIHRMNVHGMLNENLLEPSLADGPETPMPKPEIPGSEGLLKVAAEAQAAAAAAAATANASAKDPNNPTPTIFGNMIAAKLADRVICEICNKELCNKYFLKAHKLRIHGIDISPQEKAAEAEKGNPYESPTSKYNMNMTPKSEAKDPSAITAEMITADILQRTQNRSAASKKLDLSNIAPNLPSEKPSNEELVKLGIDPEAYCEICKKEFCSKYFLRTHRLNIHGIRTEKSEPEKEKERSKPQMQMPKSSLFSSMNGFGLGALGPLGGFVGGMHGGGNGIFSLANNGGLLGLGPHGNFGGPGSLSPLLPDLPPRSLHDLNPMRSQNGSINSINISSRMGLSSGGGSSANSTSSGSSNGDKNPKDKFQKHTWRWKEPINSSRVSCEICNKELCNKYFLRTHKLNKHGIIPTDKSPSIGNSPAPSDCETASNASSQPDQNVSDPRNQTPGLPNKMENSSPHPSPTLDRSFEKTANQLKADLMRMKNEEELNNRYLNNQYTEVCNLCDRRFKSPRWLKAHILKDHAGWPMLDMFDPKLMVDPKLMAPRGGLMEQTDPKACTVCGLVFPSELSMQLHLIQEHNAQVTLKTEESQHNGNGDAVTPPSEFGYSLGFKKRVFRADKQKLYACVLCDYKTKWLSNLTSHEMKMHNLANKSDVFACKLCPKSFPSELLLARHVETRHEEPFDISSSGSYMMLKKQMKSYKCGICGDKFHSRVVCNAHIREVHIRRKKNFGSRNLHRRSRYSCSQCSYSTRYPQQLQRHRSRFHGGRNPAIRRSLDEIHAEPTQNYTASAEVQCFELAVNTPDSTFLPSVAHMPVRQKVSEPMAVTFILTPVNP